MGKKKKQIILLNVMYSGQYLKNNIGHEIINLFKDDQGRNYVYVNPYGHIPEEYEVKSMLMVQLVQKNKFKVIAKATGLELVAQHCPGNKLDEDKNIKHQYSKMVTENKGYIEKNKVTYGGVKLHKLFESQGAQVCISYKAEDVRFAKGNLYLVSSNFDIPDCDFTGKENGDNSIIKLKSGDSVLKLRPRSSNKDWQFSTQSLHMIIPKINEKTGQVEDDYTDIEKLISNENYWCSGESEPHPGIIQAEKKPEKELFLSVIGKDYDELAYSNMIAYFLEGDQQLMREFVRWLSDKNKTMNLPAGIIDIFRETLNIDLLIEYGNGSDKYAIIIENKIRSDINRSAADKASGTDQNQLDRYVNNLLGHKYENKNIYTFILHPDYSKISTNKTKGGKEYIEIKYSELLNFFKSHLDKTKPWAEEFLRSLEIQAKDIDDSNYRAMERRFLNAIKQHKK